MRSRILAIAVTHIWPSFAEKCLRISVATPRGEGITIGGVGRLPGNRLHRRCTSSDTTTFVAAAELVKNSGAGLLETKITCRFPGESRDPPRDWPPLSKQSQCLTSR